MTVCYLHVKVNIRTSPRCDLLSTAPLPIIGPTRQELLSDKEKGKEKDGLGQEGEGRKGKGNLSE